MGQLGGKVAWITGAGSGIGEAAAMALARDGVTVVLTGRRPAALADVATKIEAAGGRVETEAGDMTDASTVERIASAIQARHGRLDLLVCSAGVNVAARSWSSVSPEGLDEVVEANLMSTLYCNRAVLPIMREQGAGQVINIASMSGRVVGVLTGPSYVAAKHGVVSLTHSLNMEECVNGIRATVICPGEVATPILAQRPVPVSDEDKARMLQAEDVGDLVLYVARLPQQVCLNEVQVSPTWNRGYIAALSQPHVRT
jgi:NADP-dependent 3-hydroxy acid dehydrogenase YdfG